MSAGSSPLSWDDPATREVIERYVHGFRADAPWCPWNIEFIRRVNGLDSVEEVRRPLRIEESTFRIAEHRSFLAANAAEIQAFGDRQRAAFAEERDRWAAAGEFDRDAA